MGDFTNRLCETILAAKPDTSEQRFLLGRSIADTAAVAAAGFFEPAVRNAMRAVGHGEARLWSGERVESREVAVMMNATAAHALDFDDVYLDSATHPSTVIVPAIIELDHDLDDEMIFSGVAAGLVAARAVNARLGPGHYHRGWHGTGTIGAFAATAAVARAMRLSHEQLRHALGLAAAMSGGLQINFSTMAKPFQAGFATAAGLRAARLAAEGVTAATDVFAKSGYSGLYGEPEREVPDEAFALQPDAIAVKLYPCCYGAAKLVGVALDARAQIGDTFRDPAVTARLLVPQGSLKVLRFTRPQTGLEAKFSGEYCTTLALIDGAATLDGFTDEAPAREDLRAAMDRLIVEEDPAQDSGGNIAYGSVRLQVFRNGDCIADHVRAAMPGSHDDPITPEQMRAKTRACLQSCEARTGAPFPLLARLERIPEVRSWLLQA